MVDSSALNAILLRSFLCTFPNTSRVLGRAEENCRPESFDKYTLILQKICRTTAINPSGELGWNNQARVSISAISRDLSSP